MMVGWRGLSPYLVIMAVVFAAYYSILGFPFTYDDQHYIVDSAYIKGFEALFSAFRNGYSLVSPEHFDLSRPLMPVSLTLDYSLWGVEPSGYRLTNVILHALNSIILYKVCGRLAGGRVPLLAALLFAVHPLHVEPVVEVTFREDLLVTLFYLSSLLFYMRFTNGGATRDYIFSILAFVFSLLSKEMAATLPLLLMVYHYCYTRRGYIYILPYLCVLAFYLWFIYAVYSGLPVRPSYAGGIWPTAGTAMKVLSTDLKLLFYPLNLHADYPSPVIGSLLDPMVMLSILFLGLGGWFVLRRREAGVSFCILFFLISLLPVSGMAPSFRLIADRFLYLPSAAFCILLPLSANRLSGRLGRQPLRFVEISFLSIILSYSAVSLVQGRVWKSELSLWSNVLEKNPISVSAYTGIGSYYLNEGRYEDAAAMLQKALEINPYYDKAYYNLGMVYMKKGNPDAAVSALRRAVEINPDYGKAYFFLGLAFMQRKEYDNAIIWYEKARHSMPNSAILYSNLGNAYTSKGMYEKALPMYERAISIDPGYAEAYYNMGNALFRAGRYPDALRSYEKALKLEPSNASIQFNTGNLYLTLGMPDKARSRYEAALRLEPAHEGAKNALKLIDKQEGR